LNQRSKGGEQKETSGYLPKQVCTTATYNVFQSNI